MTVNWPISALRDVTFSESHGKAHAGDESLRQAFFDPSPLFCPPGQRMTLGH
jgi:hypothetical protein